MSTDIDYAPTGILDDRDTLFTTLRNGDLAATMTAIDTGLLTGGRWFIDAQHNPGLFSIVYNPATDTSARLVVADASQLPAAGGSTSVTVHYYDRYQIDGSGNPLPGRGFAETLVFTVEPGTTRELDRFGADLSLGAASGSANPALATLSDGGFAAVWQGADQALWAQLRDAVGNARGAAFALTPSADGVPEGAPSVAALDGGRFVTAYTVGAGADARIAYRIVDAAGKAGPQQFADAGATGDSAMPDVVALQGGGFALAWRAGGQVHVRSADAAGNLGPEQVYGTLGSAFSPALAAKGASYVVSWGEINDGNVYLAQNGGPVILASGDGYAASIGTAAPLPELSVLKDGSMVVAWDSYLNSPFGFGVSDIFFQRFDAAGNRLGAMAQANLDSGGGRYDVSVTALSDGGFALAWQSQSGDFDGNGIFGRRFGADGSAIDAREFAINESRAGDQASPVLSALANGGFATAWIDTQANGAVQVEARVLEGALAPAASAPAAAAPELVTPVVTAPLAVVSKPAPAPAASAGLAPSAGAGASAGGSAGASAGGAAATYGSDRSNSFKAAAGDHKIDGLGGIDSISYGGARSMFAITREAGAAIVSDRKGGSGSDTLVNVERVHFSDVSVALDIEGVAGQAYRLYQAAFDRAPDKAGMGYWIKMMDGGASLESVAAGFAASKEFADLYGADASDARFVELLYQNVLHRQLDVPGRDYWLGALEQGQGRQQVLAFFSESGENQTQVIGAIQHGIEFTPWG
ncbi:hypothetical protein B0920_10460 [Massilia sp. KIM]|uniref:DUF4214 domain-containing protein n=1 Tax=Massilia sp. KIM TaxID=1955422 RepID=UPI00098F2A7D|nr:DUF4214 domain-containing protein [Massilia sp. KIM]OON63748.1 hypothetical protein B0920_10460 [Massilia sp. KIM]